MNRETTVETSVMQIEQKKPNHAGALLDALIEKLQLKNDAALCRRLEVPPPVISKIRHRKLPVGPTLLIRMHEESGLSIRELKSYLKAS
jgi:plasmid maintenance system antidote protein VapI